KIANSVESGNTHFSSYIKWGLSSRLEAISKAFETYFRNVNSVSDDITLQLRLFLIVLINDLKKAFDTIDLHEILIEKLNMYGVKRHSLGLLESYITNRSQKCFINRIDFGATILFSMIQRSLKTEYMLIGSRHSINNLVDNPCISVDARLIASVVRSHDYNLRNSDMKLNLPFPKTDYLKKSISFNGVKLWNDLPIE
ncbi:Hypothetical predicted protein, partial [Paramuricea clavata]